MKIYKFGYKVDFCFKYSGEKINEYYKVNFKNGYSASIIKSEFSYGGDDGLYELAILDKDKNIITDDTYNDVHGFLTSAEVETMLNFIESFPQI